MTEQNRGRAERWAPLAAGLLLAVPTLVAYYPPMTDLPLHEAVVGVLHFFRDPTYVPPIYRLNFGNPNQAFYGVSWVFALAFGVRWGCKLTIACAQIAIMVFGARVSDHLGRSRWSALLLAPLALGFTFYWGLVANLCGFVALLGAIPMVERNVIRATWGAAIRSMGMLVVAFLAHESAFVTLAGIVLAQALFLPFDRRTLARASPTVFAIVFMVGHYFWHRQFFTPGLLQHPVVFFPFLLKLEMVPNVLFGSHEAWARGLMALLAGSTLLLLGVARFRERGMGRDGAEPSAETELPEAGRVARLQRRLFAFRYEIISVGFFFLYFVMPFSWEGLTLLHERFFAPGWALLVLTVSPRATAPRVGAVCAAVLPIAILLTAWPQFVDSDRVGRDLAVLIDRIPPGSATTLLTIDRTPTPTRVFSASTAGARVPAERGGRAGMSLTVSPISPALVKPEYRWDEFDARVYAEKSMSMHPLHDLRLFSHVVAYSRDFEMQDLMVEAFGANAVEVGRSGDWILFRSQLDVIPLASSEPPITATERQEPAMMIQVVNLKVKHAKEQQAKEQQAERARRKGRGAALAPPGAVPDAGPLAPSPGVIDGQAP
jgi:hypothetical protein